MSGPDPIYSYLTPGGDRLALYPVGDGTGDLALEVTGPGGRPDLGARLPLHALPGVARAFERIAGSRQDEHGEHGPTVDQLRRAVAQLLRLFPDRKVGGANLLLVGLEMVRECAGVDLTGSLAAMTDELEEWQEDRYRDEALEYEAIARARGTVEALSPRGEDLDRALRWALNQLMERSSGPGSEVLVEARAELEIGLEAFWLSDRGRR